MLTTDDKWFVIYRVGGKHPEQMPSNDMYLLPNGRLTPYVVRFAPMRGAEAFYRLLELKLLHPLWKFELWECTHDNIILEGE